MQRVRFRRLIISLGLASMLSLLLLSGGVFAQNANEVNAGADATDGKYANDWASADSEVDEVKRTIKVTVNDQDINVPGVVMEGNFLVGDDGTRETDRTGANYTAPADSVPGEEVITATFYTRNFPIADRDGDGIVNSNDVTVQSVGGETHGTPAVDVIVLSVGANDGIVTVRNRPITDAEQVALVVNVAADSIRLVFQAATFNSTTDDKGDEAVVVSSSRTKAGIPLRLMETTVTGAPNKTVGLYSSTFIVSGTQPVDYADGGGYTTFDESGMGPDADNDGRADGFNLDGPSGVGDDPAVRVGFYAATELYLDASSTNANAASGPITQFELTPIAVAAGKEFNEDNSNLVGDATGTTAIAITAGTWNEADFAVGLVDGLVVDDTVIGVDLNGNGTFNDKNVSVGFYEFIYDADLDGDGTTTKSAVTVYEATLFPDGKRPILLVSEGDTVTVTYNDLNIVNDEPKRTGGSARDTIRIESQAPGASNFSPVAGTNTTARSPRLIVDITDGDSGVVKDSIRIRGYTWSDDNGDNVVDAPDELGVERFDYGTTGEGLRVSTLAVSGGYNASVTLMQNTSPEVSMAWQAIADDVAGNRLESSFAGLRIDNVVPSINAVYTGHAWDTTKSPAVNNEEAGVRTSVRVEFTESLDPATVEASDFRIDGTVPLDANALGSSVYLTVPEQAPDSKPVVALAGDVADRAGNTLSAGPSKTSLDGINPKVTVALDRTLTNDAVMITITTDEDIAGAPSVMTTFTNTSFASATSTEIVVDSTSTTTVFGLVSPSARTWTGTIPKNKTDAGVKSGRINVVVTAADSVGNKGTAGVAGTGSDRGAVTYELDRFINGGPNGGATSEPPTFVVSGGNEVSGATQTAQTSPFVQIVFAQEAKKEYVGDTNSMVTLTHLTVTETPAGGTAGTAGDVTGAVIRRADNEFVLPLQDLALGNTYEIAVNATDAAGNTYAAVQTSKFTVVARPQTNIPLEPGMNLISFPEIPAEPGMNEVFPATTGVDVVLAYDPSLDVPWLISQRNAEGVFGEDAEIQSVQVGRAYWVQAAAFSDITYASRPYLDSSQVPPQPPPAIPVLGGESNLIGFISLEADVTEVDADAYFSGVDWQVAYTYNSSEGWEVLRPDGKAEAGSTVKTKRGYIVFVTNDGVVTP